MLNSTDHASSEWHRVAELISIQPPHVRKLVRYLLAMNLIDSGKARIITAHVRKGRHYLRIETAAAEAFYVLRPQISMAIELRLREEVKAMLQED